MQAFRKAGIKFGGDGWEWQGEQVRASAGLHLRLSLLNYYS